MVFSKPFKFESTITCQYMRLLPSSLPKKSLIYWHSTVNSNITNSCQINPNKRAGAASLVINNNQPYDDSVLISGGATPAGFINQVTKLDLIKGEWVQLSTSGFEPR